jgi:hypothetical protein
VGAELAACRYVGAEALERIQEDAEQSHTLAAVRDALLPKLLSGELTA